MDFSPRDFIETKSVYCGIPSATWSLFEDMNSWYLNEQFGRGRWGRWAPWNILWLFCLYPFQNRHVAWHVAYWLQSGSLCYVGFGFLNCLWLTVTPWQEAWSKCSKLTLFYQILPALSIVGLKIRSPAHCFGVKTLSGNRFSDNLVILSWLQSGLCDKYLCRSQNNQPTKKKFMYGFV